MKDFAWATFQSKSKGIPPTPMCDTVFVYERMGVHQGHPG